MAEIDGTTIYQDPTSMPERQNLDPNQIKQISDQLMTEIRSKMHGRDVREALARSIEVHLLAAQAMHDSQETFSADQSKRQTEVEKRQDSVEKTFKEIIENGADDLEIIDARTDTKGVQHKSLSERIGADTINAGDEVVAARTDAHGTAYDTLAARIDAGGTVRSALMPNGKTVVEPDVNGRLDLSKGVLDMPALADHTTIARPMLMTTGDVILQNVHPDLDNIGAGLTFYFDAAMYAADGTADPAMSVQTGFFDLEINNAGEVFKSISKEQLQDSACTILAKDETFGGKTDTEVVVGTGILNFTPGMVLDRDKEVFTKLIRIETYAKLPPTTEILPKGTVVWEGISNAGSTRTESTNTLALNKVSSNLTNIPNGLGFELGMMHCSNSNPFGEHPVLIVTDNVNVSWGDAKYGIRNIKPFIVSMLELRSEITIPRQPNPYFDIKVRDLGIKVSDLGNDFSRGISVTFDDLGLVLSAMNKNRMAFTSKMTYRFGDSSSYQRFYVQKIIAN